MSNAIPQSRIAVKEIQSLIDVILQKLNAVGDCEDLEQVDKILSALNLVMRSTSIVSAPYQDSYFNTEAKKLQIHLLSVMRATRNAQSTKDWVMLSDLLEYELADNLKQWKILLTPLLKMERVSSESSSLNL